MLREQTVAIVSQCQLRYENSTKKIVSSFPHAKAQGRMECLVVQGVRRHSILAIYSIYRRIVWWYCMFERTLPMSSMQLNVDCFHCAIFCTGQKPSGLAVKRPACPYKSATYKGQKPSVLAVKRPACPYKSAIQKRFLVENTKAA